MEILDNQKFKKFIIDAKNNNRILYDPDFFGKNRNVLQQICDDVSKFDIYTFDGRFDDILINITNNFVFKEKSNYYKEFLQQIYDMFLNYVVPNMILIPLNNINFEFKNNEHISITDNIRIYNPINIDIQKLKRYPFIKAKKDNLSEYFEKNVYAQLCKEHIILTKDPHFFNNPIMTVLINNIDYKVEQEAARISEATYSFIRMIDFDKLPEGNGWGVLQSMTRPAGTYSVYYNEPNSSKSPPYNSGYGHSFIFKFDPILDINSIEFNRNIDVFKFLLNKFIHFSFIRRDLITDIELKNIDKWMNAVLLYNSAYELASKERYDATIITLLTILESLFLKNTGNKKLILAEKISQFLLDKGFDYNQEKIKDLIIDTYNHRSKFVHEGEAYYSLTSYKSINDRQGTIPGMKPFSYGLLPNGAHEQARSIYMLFRITGYVLMHYWDK